MPKDNDAARNTAANTFDSKAERADERATYYQQQGEDQKAEWARSSAEKSRESAEKARNNIGK